MTRRVWLAPILGLVFGTVGTAASAAPVTADFDTFGPLTTLSGGSVTFGGSGIPTDPAVNRDVDFGGGTTVRLGMLATPRFASPDPTNDGSGTYTVGKGESAPGLSLWNVSFFIEADNGASLTAGLTATLRYDLDPTFGTDLSDLGTFDLSTAAILASAGPAVPIIESSQNLGFSFFAAPSPVVVPPTGLPAFDPNANGEYSFVLEVTDGSTTGQVAMNVNVVPVPPALGLLGVGLLGIVSLRRLRSGERSCLSDC